MAISFNGTSSKLVWAGDILSGVRTPITIFAWVKPTSAAASYMVAGTGDNGGEAEASVYLDGAGTAKAAAYFREASGGSSRADGTTTIVTTWQPVMAVFTSGASRSIYYSSGAVVTNTDASSETGTCDRFVVGTRAKGDSLWFAGEIAEVAVWSTALTQGNFDSLAAGALPETIASGTLLDSWSLQTQGSTQVGTVSRTLTATNTSQGATHPISRGGGGGGGIVGGLASGKLTNSILFGRLI